MNKNKNSESNRRAVVTGLGAGLMAFAFFGRKSKNSTKNVDSNKIPTRKINIEKINIEIHPSAIKRNEG